MSPAVREVSSNEIPVVLEKVEVSPGNFIKMSPGDKKAWQEQTVEAERSRAAWLAGRRQVDEEPVAEAGPAVVPLTVLTKAELVDLAAARGLATSGSKAAIAARFGDDDSSSEEDETEAESA